MRYKHIANWVMEHPWAIEEAKLAAIAELLSNRLADDSNTRRSFEPRAFAGGRSPSRTQYQTFGTVAILPLMGTITQRANLLQEYSGGTSVQLWQAAFREAMADKSVATILIQIDSPGGSVYGIQELAEEIYQARDFKRVVAIADGMAASAAYWIGAAASQFSVTPSGEVGSIGVVAMHVDYSRQLDEEGIAVTFIHAGQKKVEGNPYQPLAADARDFQQSRVDDYYRAFVGAVARGRGVTSKKVEADFGQGRVFGAERAKAVGMVDRIETMTQALARLQDGRRKTTGSTAAAAVPGTFMARLEQSGGVVDKAIENARTEARARAALARAEAVAALANINADGSSRNTDRTGR